MSRAAALGFLGQAMLTSVAMPVAFFCMLLPLYAEGLHYELWQVYYWLVQCALAAFMSESCVRLGFGDPPRPLRWFVLVCVSIVPATATAFIDMPCRVTISLKNLALGISLLVPALLKFLASCWQNLALGPPACSVLFFLWGALPAMLSVRLYVFLFGAGLVEDAGHMVLAMVLWITAPISAKALSSTFVQRGFPKARFAGKVFANFYVDLTFDTLGLVLFVRSPIASVTYAASMIPALGIYMVQGSQSALRCCRRNRAVPLHVQRVAIFIEACGAVVGRAVAYTLYFCMRIAGLIADPQILYPRPSLSNLGGFKMVMSVQIFRRSKGSFPELAAAVFGFLSLWVFFAIFCVILPRVWSRDTGSVFVAPEPQSHQAPGDRNEDTGRPSTACPSSGWVLGGDAEETREQQYSVLRAFLAQHRTVFLSLILFQFMISISTVNLAESLIFLDAAAGAGFFCSG